MDIEAIFLAVESHALTSGLFERVNGHEPKNAPGSGLTCAVWGQHIGCARGKSGMNATTGLLIFHARIYLSMLAEPPDAIDPAVLSATSVLLGLYSADYTLGGLIKNIDLLGEHGPGLSGDAGYITVDTKVYRCMTIMIPMVVNDVWNQAA